MPTEIIKESNVRKLLGSGQASSAAIKAIDENIKHLIMDVLDDAKIIPGRLTETEVNLIFRRRVNFSEPTEDNVQRAIQFSEKFRSNE